jgi:hypothetical protein
MHRFPLSYIFNFEKVIICCLGIDFTFVLSFIFISTIVLVRYVESLIEPLNSVLILRYISFFSPSTLRFKLT